MPTRNTQIQVKDIRKPSAENIKLEMFNVPLSPIAEESSTELKVTDNEESIQPQQNISNVSDYRLEEASIGQQEINIHDDIIVEDLDL